MASKVILLKYLARFCDAAEVGRYLQLGLHCDKSALILKRTKTQSISIQGYPEIPFSEKSKAWFIFQVRLCFAACSFFKNLYLQFSKL